MERSLEALTVNQAMTCDVDMPCERFWIRDDSGDEVQVRLDDNGTVYVCYTIGNRRVIESRDVAWLDFVKAFRAMVNSL